MTAGQLCETFGFGKEKQWTPVGDLSGGERRRLQLLRLLMDEPNVLFLDEPTNDLDIETLTQLEDLLDGWPGSRSFISHRPVLPSSDQPEPASPAPATALRMLPRGIDEYLERRKRMEEAAAASAPAAAAKPAAAVPEKSAADVRAAKKELQKIERQLDKVSEKETKLHAQIAENATDFAKVAELDAELRELAGQREELEMRWLELAEDA
ncbi:ABC-F family ATP-binding cassette domain-containing protein [Streptomyces sp. DHE17-7]|nr:ABC-F family ATP-binding cassette domain-containing protein [Streptomyces sp. DHE17-7]